MAYPRGVRQPAEPPDRDRDRPFRGVITDWGGVMTSPIPQTVYAWLDAENIDRDGYSAVVRPWVHGDGYQPGADGNPIHALERGECAVEDFERLLASLLQCRDGQPVPPDGLLGRMFAAAQPCD